MWAVHSKTKINKIKQTNTQTNQTCNSLSLPDISSARGEAIPSQLRVPSPMSHWKGHRGHQQTTPLRQRLPTTDHLQQLGTHCPQRQPTLFWVIPSLELCVPSSYREAGNGEVTCLRLHIWGENIICLLPQKPVEFILHQVASHKITWSPAQT